MDFWTILIRKILSIKNIDPLIILILIVYGFFVFLLVSSKYCGLGLQGLIDVICHFGTCP